MSFQSFSPTAKIENKAAAIVKSILSSSASVVSANFVGGGGTSAATLLFSRPDLEEFEPRKFCRHIVFRTDGRGTFDLPDVPVDERLKAWAFSSDGHSCEARITAGPTESKDLSNGGNNPLYLEVYEGGHQLVRRQLPKDILEVRNGGPFGELVMYGQSYVLIHGERRPPKYPKTWWSTEPTTSEAKKRTGHGDDGDEAELTPLSRFRYHPNFGEKLTSIKEPCVYIYSLADDEFIDINQRLGHEFMKEKTLGFTTFSRKGRGLFLTVYHTGPTPLAREGLSVCFNRPSSIYYIEDFAARTVSPKLISEGLYMAIGPNPSPDGERVMFVGARNRFSTHITAMDLYVLESNNMVYHEVPITGDDNWTGLFLHLHEESRSLIRWVPNSGNNKVILTTQSKGVYRTFVVDINSGKIVRTIWPGKRPESPDGQSGSCSLLDVGGGDGHSSRALVMTQSLVDRPSISSVSISDPESDCIEVMAVPPIEWNGGSPPAISLVQGESCTGCLVTPKVWNQQLVARLHGGPHSFSANAFVGEVAYLLQAGFAVVLPNYRGSTSFGLDFLNALPGHAGTMDVADCDDIVVHAEQDLLRDTGKEVKGVSVFGGSHGGFLCGHLMGSSDASVRGRYQCGILWNPAVDLLSQCLTTDIPEWCFVEAFGEKEGAPDFDYQALTRQQIDRMREVSATPLAKNVDKPVLVLLGESDQRVPHMGGLRWAQAVSVNGHCPSVDVYMYPQQGHAIDKPECNTNTSVLVLSYLMTQTHEDEQ
ncbi:hypothetical protein FOZ63_002067 [Perkinsus olseni]|uniref:Peptidase S9 prolyl oligopeptidase catalytic domain-containing protein n=2 Tax=Perkinsus olseni TaxID=32597 RepID=A0A7J6QMJ5_PEROL|nr:hypothetical protein FOZ63_002067 [Perkinsus olseni]